MGGEPKQLRPLDGRPVVCWSARALAAGLAGPLVVVLPEEALGEGERLLRAHLPELAGRLRIVAGGERRQDSVAAGLAALEDEGPVLVHDAARPFVTSGLVERVAARAAGGRAVIPAIPVHDTLKAVDGDRVVRTVDRGPLVAAQTPQGFPLAILREAHAAAEGGEATDDAELCERIGAPVTWIEGERSNRKITDPEDWEWAVGLVESGRVRWGGNA